MQTAQCKLERWCLKLKGAAKPGKVIKEMNINHISCISRTSNEMRL